MRSPRTEIEPSGAAQSDDALDRALRALPREPAGPAFRAAVLARAAAAASRRGVRRRRLVSAAAWLTVVGVALGAWGFEAGRERASRRAALLDEHRRLLTELDEVRELAARRSELRLGGDATTDLYLDLAAIPALSASASTLPKIAQTRSPG